MIINNKVVENAKISKEIMGVEKLIFNTLNVSDFAVGDVLYITDPITNNQKEYIVAKISGQRKYTVEAYGVVFLLSNISLIKQDTLETSFDFADIDLETIITTSDYAQKVNEIGFSIFVDGIVDTTAKKDISFANDNLFSATQKIAQTWGLEFKITDDKKIRFVQKLGTDTPQYTLYPEINTSAVKKNIDATEVVTRLYPVGSAEGLPPNYIYRTLRPTIFNLSSGTHTQDANSSPRRLLKYDADNIDLERPIEKVVEFDVSIQLKGGSVTEFGFNSDGNTGFIKVAEDIAFLDANKDRMDGASLFLQDNINLIQAQGLKIKEWDIAAKTITFYLPEDDMSNIQQGTVSQFIWKLENYLDNDMIEKASLELAKRAEEYLEEHKNPKYTYAIDFVRLGSDGGMKIDVGDPIYIQDKIDGKIQVRVVSYTYNLEKKMYEQIELTNAPIKVPYTIINFIAETKVKLIKHEQQISTYAKTAKQALEGHRKLVKTNFYDSEDDFALIGSDQRYFDLQGLTLEPDYQDILGKIKWNNFVFSLVENTTDYTINGNFITLSQGLYFMHIAINYNNPNSSNNTIKFESNKKKGLQSDGLTYYPFGVIEVTDKGSKIYTSYGFTYINGNVISTGKIQGVTETTIFDLDNDYIDISNGKIQLGKGVLTTGGNGLKITQTADTDDGLEIVYDRTGDNDLKTFLGKDGIRQIYSISVIDQIDDSYGLSIPVYIPQNTDGSDTSIGTVRIIVKAEKFRAYSKGAADGGATNVTSNAVWETGNNITIQTGDAIWTDIDIGDTFSTEQDGSHTHDGSITIDSDGSHKHIQNKSGGEYLVYDTDNNLIGKTESIDTPNTYTGYAGSHNHTGSVTIDSTNSSHAHSINVAQFNHHHEFDTLALSHNHAINIPDHTHDLVYGIYESSDTATITIKKGTDVLGTVTTGNSIDINNEAINDGDIINITSSGLARVQVYIFVEFYLR